MLSVLSEKKPRSPFVHDGSFRVNEWPEKKSGGKPPHSEDEVLRRDVPQDRNPLADY
jgi:hypothetical protein